MVFSVSLSFVAVVDIGPGLDAEVIGLGWATEAVES
jgi:hypothetical protein